MSKTSKIIADICGILEESGLTWDVSYIPSIKAYSIYIFNEEDGEPEVERRCVTCKYWGEEITDGVDHCHKCFDADEWESKDE